MKIKPVPRATALSESLKWNLSGSGLLHIIAVLGISFYISDPIIPTQNSTLKLRLNSADQTDGEVVMQQGVASIDAPSIGAVDTVVRSEPVPVDIQANNAQSDTPAKNPPDAKPSTTEIVHTPANPLDDMAKELEKMREQQAKLMQSIREGQAAIKARPNEIFATSSSAGSEYDAYKENWRRHVEEYGNQHYPKNLSELGLSGTLILDVVVRPDGSLLRVDIVRSSGNDDIDAAALEIVTSAAPYPKLPAESSTNTLLHIIRTWQFKHNRVDSSQY